ncbi:MAG: hypothetical protein E7312_02580 [Clostridiales bacterium]|nr:hypothetical protein [Clostridiales bacterium]
MAEKYNFGAWVYFPMSDENYTVKEVDRWHECGFNVMMAGVTNINDENQVKKTFEFLDRAQELGMKLILDCEEGTYWGCTADRAEGEEKKFRRVYEVFKGHPALFGFHAGDEPSDEGDLDNAIRAVGIQKKVAPELTPYLNLMGGGTYPKSKEKLVAWMKRYKEETGAKMVCFDLYSQMINDAGFTMYIKAVKHMVEAAEEVGLEPWLTPLSSAHHVYGPSTEFSYMMQITTAAAMGVKGLTWFRLYDRPHAPNYHDSPIDEYGETTPSFYWLMVSQRRFMDQFGELFPRFTRKKTWLHGFHRFAYPIFGSNSHEIIKKLVTFEDCMISTFDCDDGYEYFCIVNLEKEIINSIGIEYDHEKADIKEVLLNGKIIRPFAAANIESAQIMLYPGQMAMFRIERK